MIQTSARIPSPLLSNVISLGGKFRKTGKAALEVELSIQAGEGALIGSGQRQIYLKGSGWYQVLLRKTYHFKLTPPCTPIIYFESTLRDAHLVLSNLPSHLKVYKIISSSKIHTQQTRIFLPANMIYFIEFFFKKEEYFQCTILFVHSMSMKIEERWLNESFIKKILKVSLKMVNSHRSQGGGVVATCTVKLLI